MENTGNVFFSGSEDKPIWFIAINHEKWIGPLAASEVLEKIRQGELTWAHYGWRKAQAKWERLCDLPEFQSAVPLQPNPVIESEVRKTAVKEKKVTPPPPAKKAPNWYLYYNDSQFGPFLEEDIHRFLKIGKIHGDVHVWKEGMGGWEKLRQVATFKEVVAESKSARSLKRPERRKTPRVPVLARSLMASGGKVFTAVCRDVSVGGMQVLTQALPGPVGTRLKLNISAPVSAGGKKIQSFVAEGQIVRVLEDGRGFSFRFEKLSSESLRCIQAYIQTSTSPK
ncbi:MAG: hypothetical protein RJB38_2042 [Pseudomonadota bacterium]|jgi:hypothetical protein